MMKHEAYRASAVRAAAWRAFVVLAAALLLALGLVGGVQPAFATQPAGGESGASSNGAAAEEGSPNLIDPQQRPDSSFIYDALISDLAEADSYYNGQTVQVTGEAVGDNISASFDGKHRWITLQADDSSYAQVTVYMRSDAAAAIDTFGAYGKTGSMVQVRGVFNLACSEHEGLSDIHAERVSVVKKGSVEEDVFEASDFIPGLVLCGLAGILVLVYYRMRERLR
ncbi:MAG: hydrolase [Eggerthellaceae bacterium]|nr:hydrolase [Eggerthellaceae bacterium]